MSKKSNIRIVREQIANFPLKSMVSQIWFDPAQVCLETPKSFNNFFFRFIFEHVMQLFEIFLPLKNKVYYLCTWVWIFHPVIPRGIRLVPSLLDYSLEYKKDTD